MRVFNKNFVFSVVGGIGLVAGLFGCGSDTSTGSDDEGGTVFHAPTSSNGDSTDPANQGGENNQGNQNDDNGGSGNPQGGSQQSSDDNGDQDQGNVTSSASSTPVAPPSSSSKKKTETASAEEELNEAKNLVQGTCGPATDVISKGELATWKFLRTSGDVFDQIMAPFVWTFSTGKTLKGNGMQEVNVKYEDAGQYTASLSVDGSTIECSPLQVQGVPIVVNSCKANAASVKAGETISWTLDATSESQITGYEWSTTFEGATVTGSGTSATMQALPAMHKQNISATVAITNADNTVQKYVCDAATVLDPESVDLVLPTGDINSATYGEAVVGSLPDSLFITAGTPMTVQIPPSATQCLMGCKPKVGSDYPNLSFTWNNAPLSNFAYVELGAGCGGKKYTIEATVTAICVAR